MESVAANAGILVVEDEGLIALDLKARLEALGYNVPAVADTYHDAIAAVERLRPSLVLMDIRLRGPVDGVETAAADCSPADCSPPDCSPMPPRLDAGRLAASV